jgi:hypothetical protein
MVASVPAQAQDSPGASAAGASGAADDLIQQQIEAMRRELERVQQENRAMRGEIDELRAYNNDQWLTEQRAQEIKTLVHEVLADADTRASLQDTGMTAGWNEHFFLGSADGRFLLVMEGLMQIRFIWNYRDAPEPPISGQDNDLYRYGFENTRTQLTFRGHVFNDDIEYLVRGNYLRSGGNDNLLDAWVRYLFSDEWALRFGQFKLPFSREALIGDGDLLAVERSLVGELFGVGRSQGIELQYSDSANRVGVAFSDGNQSNIAGTSSLNTVWSAEDTEWSFTGRYERLFAGSWQQFEDFTSPPGDEFGMLMGIAASGQQGESNGNPTFGNRDEERFFDITADLSMEWGGANAFASAYYAYLDIPNGIFHLYGLMGQAGVYIAPKWELFAQANYVWFSSSSPHLDNCGAITCGVNYYLDGQDLKWTTDISFGLNQISFQSDIGGFRVDAPDGSTQIVLRTQFQLLF